MALDTSGGDVIAVTVAGDPNVTVGQPVQVDGLVALPWSQEGRSGIVLRNTQARAELPAGSRRTMAASRIEPHRAGAVALQAVEHTDPDAVVGGPVRGCAAGYPHGRLQVVGELPVAGAFVARRLDCLCCDGGCRGHLDCSDPLFGRRLRAGPAPQGRGEVEPVRVAAGAYHGPQGQVDQEGPATG